MKVYAYGGEQESRYMVPNIQRFNDSLARQNYGGHPIDIHLSIDPTGTHQEAHWSHEFPKAVEWLFTNVYGIWFEVYGGLTLR